MDTAKHEGYDIADLDAVKFSQEGTDVEIVNPRSGLKTGIIITVQGAFASRFQEMLARQKKREAMRSKNPVARAVAQDEEDETSELLAEVTLGWRNMTERGNPVAFSKAEARRVYEAYPVIRSQVLAAALEVANFVKG